MKFSLHILCLSLITAITTGCASGIFYYETGKLSMTVEGQATNIAQPVSSNIGLKHTVVAVVPSKKPDNAQPCPTCKSKKCICPVTVPANETPEEKALREVRQAREDALSLISFFDVQKTDGTGWDDRVDIYTAFISGRAAASLDRQSAAQAAKAITPLKSSDLGKLGKQSVYRNVVIDLVEMAKTDEHAEFIVAQLNKLTLCLPKNSKYPVAIYQYDLDDQFHAVSKANRKQGDTIKQSTVPNAAGIHTVLDYWSDLNSSYKALQNAKNKIKSTSEANPLLIASIDHEIELTEKELQRFTRALNRKKVFTQATTYWIKQQGN